MHIYTVGEKHNRLTIVGLERINRTLYARCQCVCGNYTTIRADQVVYGRVKSCGCLKREVWHKQRFKHGMSGTPFYRVWQSMFRRCYSPNTICYSSYGGRGITVSKEWQDFQAFFADMYASYRPGLSIDRIDNDGPYCKKNCRWATRREQQRNRSDNVMIEIDGRTKCLMDWLAEYQISAQAFYARTERGLSQKNAIVTPPKPARTLTVGHITHTIKEWSTLNHIKLATIYYRLSHGWSSEDAVSAQRWHKYVVSNNAIPIAE